MSEHDDLAEMRSWMSLDQTDTERLRAVRHIVEPHVERIIDHFYERIDAHEGARSVMKDQAQVLRLKGTLRGWLREVFEGPHDEAYRIRRQRIGEIHVRIGLENRYMFLAMQGIHQQLFGVLRAELPDPFPTLNSLDKVLMLDLALMSGRYTRGREALQLDALQGLLVQHLRVSVFLIDADGQVRSATAASAQVAGIVEPLGRPWWEVLPSALIDAGDLRIEVARCLQLQQELTLPRVDLPGPQGPRSFRVHLVPLVHKDVALLLQLEELTDAVEMEARLQRSETLAQLGALSAAVSHELRNPLAGISGALQVIAAGMEESAPHRPILQKVDAEVRRLNSLVSDLLAFARPARAQPELVRLEVQVAASIQLVEETYPRVSYAFHGSGRAWADPDLVTQILLNLLRNAGDAAVSRVEVQVGDGRVSVSDDGGGVPAAFRDQVFKPFETTKARGTGLGLAISARHATAMHGQLTLEPSVPGEGAEFVLVLPVSG